jgi:hypothetical protein
MQKESAPPVFTREERDCSSPNSDSVTRILNLTSSDDVNDIIEIIRFRWLHHMDVDEAILSEILPRSRYKGNPLKAMRIFAHRYRHRVRLYLSNGEYRLVSLSSEERA